MNVISEKVVTIAQWKVGAELLEALVQREVDAKITRLGLNYAGHVSDETTFLRWSNSRLIECREPEATHVMYRREVQCTA